MTYEEFRKLVYDMRSAQKEYFKLRSGYLLDYARAFERRVDEELKPKRQKPTLFEEEDRDG